MTTNIRNSPTTYSVIEVHSDAVNFLVAAVVRDGDRVGVHPIDRLSEVVELSPELARSGSITPAMANKLETILRRYGKTARKTSGTVLAAATGSAAKGMTPELVEKLSAAVGQPVRVLTDTREAMLSSLAARIRLDPSAPGLLIDAGSSFTYVALTDGRNITSETMLPIGTTKLSGVLVVDPPGALSWAMLARRVGFACRNLPKGQPTSVIATGSAAHNLIGFDRTTDEYNPKSLCTPDLATLADELMALTTKKLERRRGEDRRRIAMLPPGLIIIASILEHYGLSSATVVPEGVREGIIAAGAFSPDAWWKE